MPAADPDSCGNSGCHQSVHDGHLFGARECEWCHSPTFKSFKQQYAKDMPFFDHSERTRSTSALTTSSSATTATPRRSVTPSPSARARSVMQGQPPRRAVQRVRRESAAVQRVSPDDGVEADRVQPRRAHQLQALGQARRGRVPCVPPRQGPGGLRAADEPRQGQVHRLHGLPRAQERPRSEVQQRAVLRRRQLSRRRGRSRTNTANMEKVYHGPTPSSRWSRVTRTCRAPSATPVARRTRRRSRRSPVVQREREVPRDSLHKGTLSEKCEAATRRASGTRCGFDHDEPFPSRTRASSTRIRSRARTRTTSARPVTRRVTTRPPRRRARPRAAMPTTTRTRAGSAPSARSATSRPATISSTTTRCRSSGSTAVTSRCAARTAIHR